MISMPARSRGACLRSLNAGFLDDGCRVNHIMPTSRLHTEWHLVIEIFGQFITVLVFRNIIAPRRSSERTGRDLEQKPRLSGLGWLKECLAYSWRRWRW